MVPNLTIVPTVALSEFRREVASRSGAKRLATPNMVKARGHTDSSSKLPPVANPFRERRHARFFDLLLAL